MVVPTSKSERNIQIYAQHHITLNQSNDAEIVQTEHAARTVNLHPSRQEEGFVGGYVSIESDVANDVDVTMTANHGKTVYAGSCVFLELSYGSRSQTEMVEVRPRADALQ